jgi:hypothetical protein
MGSFAVVTCVRGVVAVLLTVILGACGAVAVEGNGAGGVAAGSSIVSKAVCPQSQTTGDPAPAHCSATLHCAP